MLALTRGFRHFFAPKKMSAEPSSATTRRAPGWLGVAGIAVAILGVPALLDLGPLPRKPFDDQPVRLLKKAQPQCVFLGDSMLDSRLDEAVLNAVADRPCTLLARQGSSSAVWFLMLKNVIAEQPHPPRTVVVFFRSRQLTLPSHRAEGTHHWRLESVMRDEEPVVEELVGAAVRAQTPLLDRLSLAAYPVQRRRDDWQQRVQSWALDLVASSREYTGIRALAHEIFSAKNLRADEAQDFEAMEGGQSGLDADGHEFGSSVEHSFLPHMLQIAQAKNIRLVFFRVKRRPAENGALASESPTAPAYLAALRAYLEKAGATLIDETHDPEVTLDFYGSGDHVKTAMAKPYTEMFWRKVGPLLPPPAR